MTVPTDEPSAPADPPAPNGDARAVQSPSRRSRRATLFAAGSALVVLVGLAAALPVPYVSVTPGPVFNAIGSVGGVPLISIQDHPTYPTSGELDVTTVTELGGPGRRLSLGMALLGWLDQAVSVVPTALLYSPDENTRERDLQGQQQFQMSEQNAVAASLRYLDITTTPYVVVVALSPGSASAGKLEPGDVVASVDGTKVQTVGRMRALITKAGVGADVVLGIVRDGTASQVTVTTKADPTDPKQPLIGILPAQGYRPPFPVTIHLNDVGGPSAGLMFSLGIVDKLTPGSLNGGQHVAGTGTIDPDGAVGAIGGIEQKMAAAAREGATVFLVPSDNCAAAVAARPKELTLVRVKTLEGAVRALETVASGNGVLPACTAG